VYCELARRQYKAVPEHRQRAVSHVIRAIVPRVTCAPSRRQDSVDAPSAAFYDPSAQRTLDLRWHCRCTEDRQAFTEGNRLRLLIAIPVYNEIKYVQHVLTKVRTFHDQILVIDDGSTDGTAELLRTLADAGQIQLLQHGRNQGYGQSIIDSFDYACRKGYDWVITMDCDEQHEPEMIPEFIRQVRTDQWDIISGSRYMEAREDNDLPPGDRRTINATITATLNEMFGFAITDAFCGFKAHRVGAMIPLQLDEAGYAFPLQLWPRAARAGLRITELPVRLIYNDPNRHFGGDLDDADKRLKHYLEVLKREVERPTSMVEECAETSCCCK
jgi:glycosyltransferase involved in cell wall biosynthesis